MKRLIIAALAAAFVFTAPTAAADKALSVADVAVLPVEGFEITGGIETDDKKEIKATFDSEINISGSAEKGTYITIDVYEMEIVNKKEDYTLIDSYCLEVGSSGYFSQDVDLFIGENYIVINADKNDKNSCITSVIKRKSSSIKSELEQSVAFPKA